MAKLAQQTGTHKTTSGKSRHLEIDPEGYSLIMSFLTRAYTDPAEAVGREYTTNGIDANKITGKGPVRVTLPTRWNAEFIVEDDGPGMSEDDLDNVFRKYTASTKRDTNEQTGMFGIGSKSALAYADMFTIVSIHEGRKVAITVSRSEDGGGVMDEMIAEDVDEESGVVIRIPVHDVDSFNHSVKKYFTEVPPGLVVIREGTDQEYEDPSRMEKVIDGMWIKRREGDVSRIVYGHPKMMMGNVSYPVDSNLTLPHTGVKVFFEVGLGEYQPLPSREGIEWNKASKIKFKQKMIDVYSDLIEAFQEDPGLYYKYHQVLGDHDYQINRFFPDGHKYKGFETHKIFKDMTVKGVDYVFNEEEKQLTSIRHLNRGIVVVCPTEDDIPGRAKRRRLATVFASTPTGTMSNWIVKSKLTDQIKNTVTLEEVENKAKKQNGGTTKSIPNWDVVDSQYWQWSEKIFYSINRQVPFNEDLGNQQIVFFTRDDVVKEYHPHNRNVLPMMQLMRKCLTLAASDDDVLLVRRQSNHVEATRRDFPESMSLWEWFLDTIQSSRTEKYIGIRSSNYGGGLIVDVVDEQTIKNKNQNTHFFATEVTSNEFNFTSLSNKLQTLKVGEVDGDAEKNFWVILTRDQMHDANGNDIFEDIEDFLKKRSNKYKRTVDTSVLFKALHALSSEWHLDISFLKESKKIAPHYDELDLPHDTRYSSSVHTRLSNIYDQVKVLDVPEGEEGRCVEDRKKDLTADLLKIASFVSYLSTRTLYRTQQSDSYSWYIPDSMRELDEGAQDFSVRKNGEAAYDEFNGLLEERKTELINCIESHIDSWKSLKSV